MGPESGPQSMSQLPNCSFCHEWDDEGTSLPMTRLRWTIYGVTAPSFFPLDSSELRLLSLAFQCHIVSSREERRILAELSLDEDT